MSALRNVAQGFRKVWGMGDEDDYEEEIEIAQAARRTEPAAPSEQSESELDDAPYERTETRTNRASYAPTASVRGRRHSDDPSDSPEPSQPSRYSRSQDAPSGGSRTPGGRGLRPVAMPLRAREKNIYTLKPKSMDEASLAADYLKTGCAVVVNLEEVERMVAVRIIDFMSGVCYGLEHQGHAMKLGEIIFLFTPGDFEISSDEVDYGENRDFIFKDVAPPEDAQNAAANSERRSWER